MGKHVSHHSRRLVLATILALTLGLVSGASAPATASQPRLKIVATFSIIGDLTRNVGGDRIALTTLVGADGDSERYEPTPADARALGDAELILENGLGSEPWLERLYPASRSSAPRIQVSQRVDLIRGPQNEPDPHFWHDAASAMIVVQTIRDALAGIDPPSADAYGAAAEAYLARLEALDAWVVEGISTLPPERRKMVTSHDTFRYFTRRYGIEIVGAGLNSFSTDSQPSAAQVNRLVQDIRAAGVPAIFLENVTDQRLMQRIGREAGILVAPALYTDALGPVNSPASTYLDLMTYNVQTIVWALGR